MAEWNQCYYCGRILKWKRITYDHVVPESYGGTKLVVACQPCNNLKADLLIDEYRELVGVEQFYGEQRGWVPW